MERKVGEIFEYNGEWYQCVECDSCGKCPLRTTECGSGTKSDIADEVFGECSKLRRSDSKSVIFKKLEKVGDPYVAYGLTRQKYKLHVPLVITNEILDKDISCDEVDGIIDIRTKQNKENMEEEKLNLKKFDLEAAKAGKPVCTRDGRKARIISFDRHGEDCPIIALVVDSKNAECEEVIDYTLDGICNENIINHNKYDLMMLTRKKEGWIIIHKEAIYDKETAEKIAKETTADVIRIQKIEWEE